MRAIIWTILFAVLCFLAGIVTGKYSCEDTHEVDRVTIEVLEDVIKKLKSDIERYAKYIPITEYKKDYIIARTEQWDTQVAIAKSLWVTPSLISKALKSWWVNTKKSV